MVTHSSILAWRIPRIEEPGSLQSICMHSPVRWLLNSLFGLQQRSAGRDRACWGLRIWGQGEVGAGLGWRGPATLRAFPMCSVYVWAVPGASQIKCGSSEH